MATEDNVSLDQQTGVPQDTNSRAVFTLEGMTCASCALHIEKGLKKVPGVLNAQVNFAIEQATVIYDPTQTDLEQMVQKVETVGYKAMPVVFPTSKSGVQETNKQAQTAFIIEGATCASCALHIEEGLKKVPGVLDAQLNFVATLAYDPEWIEQEQMLQKVEAEGYKAAPFELPTTPWPVPSSEMGTTTSLPFTEALQEDEQSRRKQVELMRKQNILLLGFALLLPIIILTMFLRLRSRLRQPRQPLRLSSR